MDEFGLPLPMGDLRQGLVGQSRSRRLWRDLFAYRFASSGTGEGLGGHSLGNLILRALEDLNGGDLIEALSDAQEMLNTVGQVVPITLERSTLCAELTDGTVIRGEDRIGGRGCSDGSAIRRVFLDPVPTVHPRARKALERSSKIILGPGDLYTSVLPILLVEGTCSAILESDAEVVYIVNLMSRAGETDGYRASDFVAAVVRHLGRTLDTVVVHTAAHRPDLVARYAQERAAPVEADLQVVEAMANRVVVGDFATEEPFVRHDAEKVIDALWPV